ncbi:MAG: Oligopeptide transporter, ATP-binding protein [Thermomicrobiales bacterium]|nr:Oligopeptide transporter, ATP-binding protein [Thermomicrobiales bacterium]
MSTHPADQQSDAARLHRVGEPCTTARLSGQPSEATIPLVEARNLVKHFSYASGGMSARTTGTVHAVDDVSIVVPRGRTVGLVGESGCGKSTVGRLLLRLIEPTSGSVWFDGEEITRATRTEMRRVRRHMQIVFQDPHSSLNPRRKIGEIVSRPLVIHGEATRRDADRRAGELLSLVGLDSDMRGRFPHEFSKRELGLTYLFISHNLNVVEYFCDTTVVMYLGQVVESGPSEAIHAEPLHPYTQALISAVLVPEVGRQRNRLVLSGDIPSPVNPPSGCRFHTRCPFAMEICRQVQPLLTEQAPGHRVACHLFPVDGRVPASHVAREKGGVGHATA